MLKYLPQGILKWLGNMFWILALNGWFTVYTWSKDVCFLSITMLGYQRTQQGFQSGCKVPNHRKTRGYDVIFQQEHHDNWWCLKIRIQWDKKRIQYCTWYMSCFSGLNPKTLKYRQLWWTIYWTIIAYGLPYLETNHRICSYPTHVFVTVVPPATFWRAPLGSPGV